MKAFSFACSRSIHVASGTCLLFCVVVLALALALALALVLLELALVFFGPMGDGGSNRLGAPCLRT